MRSGMMSHHLSGMSLQTTLQQQEALNDDIVARWERERADEALARALQAELDAEDISTTSAYSTAPQTPAHLLQNNNNSFTGIHAAAQEGVQDDDIEMMCPDSEDDAVYDLSSPVATTAGPRTGKGSHNNTMSSLATQASPGGAIPHLNPHPSCATGNGAVLTNPESAPREACTVCGALITLQQVVSVGCVNYWCPKAASASASTPGHARSSDSPRSSSLNPEAACLATVGTSTSQSDDQVHCLQGSTQGAGGSGDLSQGATAEIVRQVQQEEIQGQLERALAEQRDSEVAALLMQQEELASQRMHEERKAREAKDAEAAAQLERQEREQLESDQKARQAQAQADLTVARLLDSVSERTGQDVAELDRRAVLRDHEPGATFECPILYIECDKREEGVCIGHWNRRFCNHWVSRDALVQYIVTEAEEGRFSFRCPVCSPARCARCVYHASSQRDDSCCFIPQAQLRSVLTESQLERLLELQEKMFRSTNCDSIVQCPHPDCQYYYVLGPEDMAEAAAGHVQGDGASTNARVRSKWAEGRGMWCGNCEIQYCLHCGEKLGTLVKWHEHKTCSEFLQEASNAKATAERKKLEDKANAGHEQNRGKTWQRCPKCKYEAWKPDDQCNRIVCRCRSTNFCFLCGEDITVSRYDHFAAKKHPCYGKVWHNPLAGTEGRPPCRCEWCSRASMRKHQ